MLLPFLLLAAGGVALYKFTRPAKILLPPPAAVTPNNPAQAAVSGVAIAGDMAMQRYLLRKRLLNRI